MKGLSNSELSRVLSAAIAADNALRAVQARVGVARAGKGQGFEQQGELGRLFLRARQANRALLGQAQQEVQHRIYGKP